MKKQIFFTVLFFLAALPAGAQLYQPGEVLDYRASYKAKFFPNTEVGSVRVTTVEEEYEGEPMYRIVAHGKTLPAFRWVMNVDDKYTILVDREELKTRRFESDIREGNYRFWSNYVYDWPEMTVHTRWQGRRMVRDTTKTMSLTPAQASTPCRSISTCGASTRQRSRKEKRRCSKCSSKIRSAICGTAFWGVKPRKSAVWVRSAP